LGGVNSARAANVPQDVMKTMGYCSEMEVRDEMVALTFFLGSAANWLYYFEQQNKNLSQGGHDEY
jgi:hypothetical protein